MNKVFGYFIWFVFCATLLFSCKGTDYQGYKKTKNGIYYKLLAFGESEHKAQIDDYITVDLVYKTMSDSVFFKARRKFQLTNPGYEGSVEECFMMLSVNDHASFIISADNFFNRTIQAQLPSFLNQGDHFILELKMVEIQTPVEYEKEKEAFLHWIEDFGEYERVILKQFISGSKLNIKPSAAGLYHLMLQPGNGNKVERGDTVLVHYEGKFLNGKYFDSTVKRKDPFQFVYGQQWQVVEGIEQAIGMMEEGEKSLFILPSSLAFGQEGSSTGIIPPFTSLIFEVELISLKKKNDKS